MDKYPYFTEKNLHKHYKAFFFFIFSSWRSKYLCITEREKQFPTLHHFLAFARGTDWYNVKHFISTIIKTDRHHLGQNDFNTNFLVV